MDTHDILWILFVGIFASVLFFGFSCKKGSWTNAAASFVMFTIAFGFIFLVAYNYFTSSVIVSVDMKDVRVFSVLKKAFYGEGAFLYLYDVKQDNNRYAYFSVYPPKGYKETVTGDNRTILAPEDKKIIVGEPDKIEFVPAVVSKKPETPQK